jgi:hypothetical protein
MTDEAYELTEEDFLNAIKLLGAIVLINLAEELLKD